MASLFAVLTLLYFLVFAPLLEKKTEESTPKVDPPTLLEGEQLDKDDGQTILMFPYAERKEKVLMKGFSKNARLDHRSYLDWIISALNSPTNNVHTDSFVLNVIKEADIDLTPPKCNDDNDNDNDIQNNNNNDKTPKYTEEEQAYAEIMKNAMASKDKHGATTPSVPTKIAASQVSSDLFDKIFKVSENTLNASDEEEVNAIKERIALMRSPESKLSSLLEKNATSNAAQIGTATHAFLQFCDFKKLQANGFDSELERLKNNEFISVEDASRIKKSPIDRFVKSNFFKIILECLPNVRREFRFGLFEDAESFAQNPETKNAIAGKKVYVQGSIDILMETKDGEIYLCDYKTDRIDHENHETPDEFKTRLLNTHRPQLTQYKEAVEKIYGKAPDKIFIYSFSIGEAVELNI